MTTLHAPGRRPCAVERHISAKSARRKIACRSVRGEIAAAVRAVLARHPRENWADIGEALIDLGGIAYATAVDGPGLARLLAVKAGKAEPLKAVSEARRAGDAVFPGLREGDAA